MTANDRYDSLFVWFGAQSGVPSALLKAQVHAESAFNPRAVSPAGAKGLAQFMPATWTEWGHGDPFNPEEAIKAQSRYMASLLKTFKGERHLALAAYNFGIGHVQRGTPWPKETIDYVNRILGWL